MLEAIIILITIILSPVILIAGLISLIILLCTACIIVSIPISIVKAIAKQFNNKK